MTTAATKQSNIAAVAFGAFAVVLLVVFFTNRGGDVGQLASLVSNLGGGPSFGSEGFRDSFLGLVIAVLIGVSWFGLGTLVSIVARSQSQSRLLDLATKTAMGAAIWSLIWFLLGIAGAYGGPIAIAALTIGVVLASLGFRRGRENSSESNGPDRSSGSQKVLFVVISLPLGLALIAALAPPAAKDTLLYHFAVPKAFLIQHSNTLLEGNIASYLALGTEMHTVWAMLLGNLFSPGAGEAAAGATTFLFFPLLLVAVYGWTREIGISQTWSVIATLIVATIPTAYHVASSGYVDLSLALYVTLATYSLTRWWKEQTWGWVILIALFLGAALSVKLTAVFVFAAFALVILMRARSSDDTPAGSQRSGRIVASGLAALVLAAAIASPWYIRTWAATGSPVFPFYMNIVGAEAPGWDVERSNLFQAINSQHGSGSIAIFDEFLGCSGEGIRRSYLCILSGPVGGYLLTPITLSIAAQPEEPAYFDGVLGVAFLFGLLVLIWGLWKFELPIAAKVGSGVAGVMFLFWLFSGQQLRYLLPIMPMLAVAIIASASSVATGNRLRSVLQGGFILASLAGILVSVAWFARAAPLRVVLGGETRDDYLSRNLDYYPYYQWINSETTSGDKVWLINMRRDTYHIDRPVFSDYFFEDWTLRQMVWESRTAQELRAKTAERGIKYVLTRHDFLFDYDRSTLVDDKKPRAENEAKLRIAKEFILDPANSIKADKKFSLVKVF